MSSAGAVPIKTKTSTAAVGKAEAEIQAKQANVKDLKNIDIDSQHLNYEISSIPRESWWKTEEKDVNNDLSHSMSVFPSVYARLITRTKMYAYMQFSPPKNMCVFHVMRLPTTYFFKLLPQSTPTT